ncbi:glutamate--cysteine ligase catalytic subunit-like [Ixodes scapularis]|uniref:glutamate--cysteine ligase catalytic subunit-like n=1 Tax=Ixodes scapularis TaxID=6945 RepID=UPI001A9DDB16|nr:glutamate--cysteine ligase catalytic subunit-like [Ixodes scapularis]
MGLLSKGTPFTWEETKARSDYVRHHGIVQFLNLYRHVRHRRDISLRWGDEMEYMLVRFDHKQRKVQLLLKAAEIIRTLNEKERESPESCACSWHPEFSAYALEAVPLEPYGYRVADYNMVEQNMRRRRAEVRALLDVDEEIICLTTFPMMGCRDFTYPSYKPSRSPNGMQSLFLPDEMVYPNHPRFMTNAKHVKQRRGKRVVINIPIFKDEKTPNPFIEDFKKLGDDGEAQRGALPDHIYMDAHGFGMGNCCVQVTLQAADILEAMTVYDQLANMAPVMLALGASTPAFRGYLANTDCRFNAIRMCIDDRTEEEMGNKPGKKNARVIRRPRFASIPCFLSAVNQKHNDVPVEHDEKIYKQLLEGGVEEPLAKHFAHIFLRDTLILYKELMFQNDEVDIDHFENLQSTSWHTLRFKPPSRDSETGWKIEFRPMELQLTEFENAAYIIFVVLLTRIILTYNLDMTVPISKVDENIEIAQKVDAVLNEKFWFRKDILTHGCRPTASGVKESDVADVVKMSIGEIINGKEGEFPGLIPLIRTFLTSAEEVNITTYCSMHQYLELIGKRASGDLMTTAHWMRQFVRSHPEYKKDSIITDTINYDLIMRMFKHQHNFWSIPELLGMPSSRSSTETPGTPSSIQSPGSPPLSR